MGYQRQFFDLGDILYFLISVHQRIKQRMQIEASIQHLYEFPTIITLAAYINGRENSDSIGEEFKKQAKRRTAQRIRKRGTYGEYQQ